MQISVRKMGWLLLMLFGTVGNAVAEESDSIEHGQYLIKVSGCNDCHTAGYIMLDGNVPVNQWLKGDVFGWRGGWGTTYPSNLRLFVKDLPCRK